MATNLTDLENALKIAPVMGQFHPLVPLCLPQDVEVMPSPDTLLKELDSVTPHLERPILITQLETKWAYRFQVLHLPACPPVEIINQNLPQRIEVARNLLLTSRNVANRIVADAFEKQYDTVMLLLVDGLSYADIIDWPEQPQPCFIDGPTITFSRTQAGSIDPQAGFPAIIGTPALARRLVDLGLSHSRGFSYWEREQNDVSAKLFEGVPLEKVGELAEAFDEIQKLDLRGFYIQLVREGLDGLAHSRREVSQSEIKATIQAIHEDFRRLVSLMAEKAVRGAIYLIADHGILWKNQHQWQLIENDRPKRPRYASNDPNKPDFMTKFSTDQQDFYLWHYPYLGRAIRANDKGVHGGLSYWESIVPFVKVEVHP